MAEVALLSVGVNGCEEWRTLVHHFYDSFRLVEQHQTVS